MTTYHNGSMVADKMVLHRAKYIRRDPETYEISWEPSDLELELADLGLIEMENDNV